MMLVKNVWTCSTAVDLDLILTSIAKYVHFRLSSQMCRIGAPKLWLLVKTGLTPGSLVPIYSRDQNNKLLETGKLSLDLLYPTLKVPLKERRRQPASYSQARY